MFSLISSLVLALSAIAAPTSGTYDFKYRVTNIVPKNAPHELIVFNPTITSPQSGFVWDMGKTYQATWSTQNIPPEKQNGTGLILLGHAGNGSENLDICHPLATNFPLIAGAVPITMPSNVATRDDYFIVLFGDSGNASPQFTIASPT
ncbi:hypothetical protein APHAL10511_002288 [Amanita phalloides]|nr:hypothetical protein APHAL10511_002288 [Amanita phalloides]